MSKRRLPMCLLTTIVHLWWKRLEARFVVRPCIQIDLVYRQSEIYTGIVNQENLPSRVTLYPVICATVVRISIPVPVVCNVRSDSVLPKLFFGRNYYSYGLRRVGMSIRKIAGLSICARVRHNTHLYERQPDS